MAFRLGSKAKDKITGFQGVITGHARYLTGCDQYCLVPAIGKDGSSRESKWFDEQRIEILSGKPIVLDNSRGTGADMPAPLK